MSERFARCGGVTLCHEVAGEGPLVLLVMGLGLDLGWWKDAFCAALAGRGLRVVRFDNRDVGRSTPCSGPGITAWQFLRRRAEPVYTLGEMAEDAAGLIAALGDGPAHVVGVSMGSLIAQELAIRAPDRVASLVSIMGRPGDGRSGRVAWRMRPEFVRSTGGDPEEALVRSFRRIGSTSRTAEDDEDVREAFRRAAARARGDGSGSGRQLAAIVAERDRTAMLGSVRVPATVIHGLRDRVIVPSGGRATAAALPDAELVELEGMGHDLPRAAWSRVIDAIERTVARAV